MLIDGIHIPLTTPFTRNGDLYLRKLAHNVGRYSLTPAAGFVALTGEGTALSDEETINALRIIAAAAPEKVLIAGDFNNWSPMSTPMINRGRPGEFWMCLPLQPGRYRYRFVVDGKWMTDPHNTCVETNQFGELNNIVEVA